jgi:homoserine acetyltransferase
MLHTWQVGDVSKQEPYNGDFHAAMQAIKAKALVLPCKTDLYFRAYTNRKSGACLLTVNSSRGLRDRGREYATRCGHSESVS